MLFDVHGVNMILWGYGGDEFTRGVGAVPEYPYAGPESGEKDED